MKLSIGSNNRLTLPKQFCDKFNIKVGTQYEIDCINGVIVFMPIIENNNQYTKLVESNKNKADSNVKNNKNNKNVIFSNSLKFKSNLEIGQTYTEKKYYSECGYMIRTKTRYLKKLCSECRGQLFDRSCRFDLCPYSNKDEYFDIDKISNKTKLNNIESNIKKLDNDIQKSIVMNGMEINKATVLQPVTYKHHHQCFSCEEYVDKGFLVDKKFCCKKCVIEFFTEYMKMEGRLK